MLKEELIAALKNKDFEAVTCIASRLGKQTSLELRTAASVQVRADIYQNFTLIINEALHLARVLKAHIGTELHANSASFLYTNPDLEHHRWQIKA